MASSSTKDDVPLPEPLDAVTRRLKLIGIYALYFILIGLPMWFYTTSIYQSNLPIEEIEILKTSTQVQFDIPVYVNLPSEIPQEVIIQEAQTLVDQELINLGIDLSEYHISLFANPIDNVRDEEKYEVIVENTKDEDSIFVSPYGRWVKIMYSDEVLADGKVADFIKRVVVDELFHDEISQLNPSFKQNNNLALPYAPHYNLVFSLVVENGTAMNWEIADAIDEYFTNFIEQLSTFTKLSIDTQIQYYCSSDLELLERDGVRLLNMKDLSTFVDFGSWNLIDAISLEPTINFLLYIPKSPLIIENSNTGSFIIPQWGSVKIHNAESKNIHKEELLPVLEIFSSQLVTLLGFPKNPKSFEVRMDIIKRSTLRENISKTFDNLNSLIKLVHQLLDIPIPEATLSNVKESVELIKLLNTDSLTLDEKLAISNAAVKSSNDAFFQKDMIQQNYFPQAHKFTIYLPIVGPVVLILLNSLIRCVVDYKRRERHANLHVSNSKMMN